MYVSIDIETGGIGLDKSLLSIALIFADEHFVEESRLVLDVKPNDGIYHTTGEALGINKINLFEHDKVAVTYKQAGTLIYNSLENKINKGYIGTGYFNKSGKFLKVLGKNVYFDLTHIWDKLVARATWEQFCSHQTLDLTSVWGWLELTGQVEKLAATSLVDVAEALGITYDMTALHGAAYDAELTLACFRKLYLAYGQDGKDISCVKV